MQLNRVAARVTQLNAAARHARAHEDQVRKLIDETLVWQRNAEYTGIAERFAALVTV